MSKKFALGEFEELVLLTIGVLYDEAYGLAIKKELEKRRERAVSIGALQSALIRLEKKGFAYSKVGEPTKKRGGRRKRYFFITAHGKEALEYQRNSRMRLWNDIPDIAFDV